MNQPLVSIIIANWNGAGVFKDCLVSLAKIKYPNWELVVVDNGSTDDSADLAEQVKLPAKRVLVIKNNHNVGFAGANNQGYDKSQGEYVLLLNNDTKVDPNFLSLLVKRLEDDLSVGVIQPKIYLMDKPGYLDNAGSYLTRIGFLQHWGFLSKDSNEFSAEKEVFSAKGACILIRRAVLEKVGLFDSAFGSYFEESDFCWRVWLAGWKVLFFPQAVIYHKVGFTIKRLDVVNINFDYYKNRIRSLIKNLELLNLIQILTVHIFISLGLAGLFLIKGKAMNALMIIKAVLWNLTNLDETLKLRKGIQSTRVVTDQVLFLNLMKSINWSQNRKDLKRIEDDLKAKN